MSSPQDEQSDQTTPRESAPVSTDVNGAEDPDGERLLQTLIGRDSGSREG
jgi:hypothetical protein